MQDLTPLAGGHSGETFLSEYAGERSVVRIYGGRSAARGEDAALVDAAVMGLVRGLVPVPAVLEARRAAPEMPALLVTEFVAGERLEELLPGLDDEAAAVVGDRLGVLLGRLGHMVMPRFGMFAGPELTIHPAPPEYGDLAAFARKLGLDLPGLGPLIEDAQELLDLPGRTVLAHSDFNPKNILVDPGTLEITAVLDWEFAHAGTSYTDLGNLLRFETRPVFVEAVVAAYRGFVPGVPDDLLERARAADLFALVELAARAGDEAGAHAVNKSALKLLTERAGAYPC